VIPLTTSLIDDAWLDEVPPRFREALTKFNGPIPDATRSLGPQVCEWIEKVCVFGEGDRFGKPVRLEPWQKALLWKLYEIRLPWSLSARVPARLPLVDGLGMSS
jgi:hypothetical protein